MIKVVKHDIDLKGEPMLHRSLRARHGLTIRLPGNRTLTISGTK